jgi:hypothetical protein
MEEPEIRLKRAEHLEKQRFNQFLLYARHQRDLDQKALQRDFTARGLFQSGGRFKEEMDLHFESTKSVLEKAFLIRRDISSHVPELLTAQSLDNLDIFLQRIVDGFAASAKNLPEGISNPAAVKAMGERVDQRAMQLRAHIHLQISTLKDEAELGIMPSNRVPMTTINISNSTIANLNLGNVVGDLKGSIQQLSTSGHQDLAEKVGQFGEAIAESHELDDAAKKDILEHLSVVSDEAVKTPEKRKLAPVKSAVEAIKSGLTIATGLLGLWQGIEHVLRAMGIIP